MPKSASRASGIRPYINEAFERSQLSPGIVVETNSIEVMRQMAIVGESVTFLTPFDIESEQRLGRLVYLPVHEFARYEQRLMLIQNERRTNTLASVLAESLKSMIGAVVEEPATPLL